jgi:hypothetical protein
LWTNRYNGPANGFDTPVTKSCLAIGPDGAVYVTGTSDGNYSSVSSSDYATIKYLGTTLLPVPLHYQIASDQLVLTWTNAAFGLQSAPAVQGAYTNISGATSPHTNVYSGTQRYFRLERN